MSIWYEIKEKDIDFSLDGDDLHIYLGSDYSGAIYATIPLKIIDELFKKRPKVKKKTFYEPEER
jgi:hypothetical protein